MIPDGATLVLHPGALGDVLLAVPALRALRARHPERPLVLAAQPRLGDLLAALGEVDRAVDFEALGLDALFTSPPGPPRLAIARAGRVVCWFGSRDPGFAAAVRALAPGAVVAAPAGTGEVSVWRHLLGTVGSPIDGAAASADAWRSVTVTHPMRAAGQQALREAGWDGVTPLLALQPGAGGAAKCWPVAGFAAIVRELSHARALAIAVHQGPADAEPAAALVAALGPGAIALREPTLPVLAGALAAAALYVGNDSGVSHLAAAVGAPSVVLFTSRLLAWRPWAPHAQTVAVSMSEVVPEELRAVAALAAGAMAVDSTA